MLWFADNLIKGLAFKLSFAFNLIKILAFKL